MKYLTYQLERAPTTGQLHLQGAVRMKSPTKLNGVKRAMKTEAVHLEPARAWDKAKEYANKTETRVSGPWTHGEDTGQGHRSDLEASAQMIKAGKRDRELAEAAPVTYMRCYKGVSALRSALARPTMRNVRVALFWGETGTGKTWTVTNEWLERGYYTVFDVNTPWFDGYQGEEHVLFDEMGPGAMDINKLKRFLDKYPVTVPIKGSSGEFRATTIVLTSNTPIDCWYPTAREEDIKALKRRVTSFYFPREKEDAKKWLKGPTTWQGQPEPIVEVLDDEEEVHDLERSDAIWPYE